MANTTVDVACFYCFAPNRVGVGVEFYESRAFYTCHACKRPVSLHITQTPLTMSVLDADVQEGKPIDG